MLLDQHRDCCVLVPTEAGIKSVPIAQLLPYSYLQPDEDPRRFFRFNARYYDDVVTGRKTRTVRYLDPPPVGRATFVFEDGEHLGFKLLTGVIDSSVPLRLSDLDADYLNQLRRHYPDMPADALLDDVRFHVEAEQVRPFSRRQQG